MCFAPLEPPHPAIAIAVSIAHCPPMSASPSEIDSHFVGLSEFRRALRQFLAYSELITRQHGVTSQQYQALLALKVLPPESRTVTDIAAELLLKHHSAVELTKRMEKAGLVVRNRNPENRRKVDLSLTAAGLKTLETLAELHRDELLRHGDRIQRAITFL